MSIIEDNSTKQIAHALRGNLNAIGIAAMILLEKNQQICQEFDVVHMLREELHKATRRLVELEKAAS